MKPPKYPAVLFSGSDERLNAYIDRSRHCLVVDWRSDEDGLTDALGEMLPRGWLTHEWVDEEEDMEVTYRGVPHRVGLTLTPRDRYVWLRRMNELMAGDFELRAFRHTLGDDTHCFYLGRRSWWAAMEAAYPAEVGRVFARITAKSDFFV